MSSIAPAAGDQAPEFTLPGTSPDGGTAEFSLAQFRGRPVVVAFYPGDDTSVCTRQLNDYNAGLDQFDGLDTQILAISPQDLDSHERFAGKYGFRFPLLADIDKSVARSYSTLGPLGFPRRSVFVIDGDGIVRYAHRAIAGLTFRPTSELVAVLSDLS